MFYYFVCATSLKLTRAAVWLVCITQRAIYRKREILQVFHGRTTVSVTEVSVCGTACHRTYDNTWTSRISSITRNHFLFCLVVSHPRRIV